LPEFLAGPDLLGIQVGIESTPECFAGGGPGGLLPPRPRPAAGRRTSA